ncbi:lipoprotein [Streptococcus pneumoniae]|uniref:SP_0198 family lipoprotein n=1 Tax=Streptococcus pneumoniae TaxID=1313 RepID=UPI0010DFEB6D|nr:SP_0198 family lipoprotein [Streptococcus pneumoniae]MDD0768899.1 SP_0198 family lipoprotein [Streptococcus pneumoniae]MDS2287241.1 SP_0198 family lipoprotein [Streptococcus pneumoniae]MDS3623911.1 SP_0198 family lipoprotein [Streptococcus pneumoniae]MDS3664765.1 SP_0198 family lipoprotein [Streptococcus pneumoniae]MDS4433003.1 SP_0198 family lipoprotein [Streptococcus pneumoniae]
MKLKRFTLSLASLASFSLLVACSQRAQQVQQPVAQQQVQQPAQQPAQQNTNTANAGGNQNQAAPVQNQPVAQPTDIDGTYTGQDDGDCITLVVTGTTGTWTELESDGDQKVKQVTFDSANQRMIIGDDVKIYTVNGNQIVVDDMDRDPSDQIVLTK